MKKKLLLLFLLLALLGCSSLSNSQQKYTSNPIIPNDDFIVVNDNTLSLNPAYEYVLCSIDYNNGAKLNKIPFFLENIIIKDTQVDENLVLFEDFTMYIYFDKGQSIMLKFHDKHYVTWKDVTFPISSLPFKESMSLSEEEKKSLATGTNLKLGLFMPAKIKDIEINFKEDWKLIFKSEEASDRFIDELRNSPLTLFKGDSFTESQCQNEEYEFPPVRIRIRDEKDNILSMNDACSTNLKVNSIGYTSNKSVLTRALIKMLEEHLILLTPPYGSQSIFLKPILYECDDFIITTPENSEINNSLPKELIEFENMGLVAYENGEKLDTLPLDHELHAIYFYDLSENKYEYVYQYSE